MGETGRSTEPRADERVTELVKRATEQASLLVRDEVRLAAAELAGKGKRAGIGIGSLGGAGLLALYGVAALLAAAVLALTLVLPAWAAALIVGGAVLAVAGTAALVGKQQIARANPPLPQEAKASVKADIAEIKERAKR